MTDQRIALVTGANKGIGYAIAAGLGARGWRVGIGARDDARRGAAIERLRAGGADVFGVALDVTDDASVAEAVTAVGAETDHLDVLVNNAGIAGDWPDTPSQLTSENVEHVLATNAGGVIRVTNAFLPLLRAADGARIVNQSSHVGSLTLQTQSEGAFGGASGIYSPSKTLVNAITVQYAHELAPEGIDVLAVAPGYVATDLNGFAGQQSVDEGAAAAIRAATEPGLGTGVFLDAQGTVAW